MSSPNPFAQQPQGFSQPSPGGFGPPPPQPRRGPSCLTVFLFLFGCGAGVAGLACCGGVAMLAKPPEASASASEPLQIDDVPVPKLPGPGQGKEVVPSVLQFEYSLGEQGGYYNTPGHGGKLLVYVPAGKHKAKSLPCILITGAGSDLLSGMLLGDGDNPEQTPYAQAGYAVVAYELDGPSDQGSNPMEMKRAYEAFRASRAGLVNARNALEFALAKVPEVNPSQIYAAGHSSAATHALLFAEHEPRLAGVIAYAPAVNIPERFGGSLRVFAVQLPGVVDFATQSSPHTHRERLKCPTFLFHAEDDSNCPIAQTRKFAEELKEQGTDVTLVTVATGNHYNSMINEGIPAAIKWLRQRERMKQPAL
jgi:dienelactone hydrolase